MNNKDQTMYEIPVPGDLDSIRAIHDGQRWINGVIPGTIELRNGILYFSVKWGRRHNEFVRRFTLAADVIAGYQCDG